MNQISSIKIFNRRFDEKDDKMIKYWKFMHLLNI